MARPKKDLPHHSSKMFEFKATIGYNSDGSSIRKSFYSAKSKAVAEQKSIDFKIKQGISDATGEIFVEKNVTFESYAIKFLKSVLGTVKDNTYNNSYKNVIDNHLTPYFGKQYLTEIKQIDIQTFINLKAQKYSFETVHKHKNCLHTLFDSALNNNVVKQNPVIKIKMPPNKPVVIKSVYTQEHTDLIAVYAKTHVNGLAIVLMLGYGLSRNEVLGLMWGDLNAETQSLNINRGVTDVQNAITRKMEIVVGDTKNAFRKREIVISQETVEMINAQPRFKIVGENKHKHIEGKKVNTEFMITNRYGQVYSPRSWSRHQFGTFMEDMHEYYLKQEPPIIIPELNPHELRHTRASLWVNDGVNLFAIANELGHADLKMLRKKYAHPDIESMRKLLNIK